MPGELSAATRLLQAVCYPGHGILLDGHRAVVTSGDAEVLASLRLLVEERPLIESCTLVLDEALQACIERRGNRVLLVAVPRTIDALAVHAKLRRAMDLFLGPPVPWVPDPDGNDGGSGAPAEVSLVRMRRRSN
jgi:hypothetical protein